jgi:aspartate-semialdehyde dehydrogenase
MPELGVREVTKNQVGVQAIFLILFASAIDREGFQSKVPAPFMKEDLHIAIAGATGAVGIEMLKTLEKRNFPVGKLTPLASKRSAGKTLTFRGEEVVVEELTTDSFKGVDIALFSAGGGTSKEFASITVDAGAVVVDNSSAFRMDDSVPLVVPEINAADVATHKGIIANPNCSTIVTVMALNPLHLAFGVKRIFASTYQAVSGSGAMGIVELERQVGEITSGNEATKDVYPHQIAFNVLPHVDVFLENGYTKEEMKMVNESRKIMGIPDFQASVTCVRVPVYRAHSIAVSAEFERPVSVEEARAAIEAAPGIDLNDDVSSNGYPLPLELAGADNCQVGRIRKDNAFENGLSFWVVGDQLLKGAALNTVQIAEEVAKL